MNLFYIFILVWSIDGILFTIVNLISKCYCDNKIKKNDRKKCSVWDCPRFNNCEFNGDD